MEISTKCSRAIKVRRQFYIADNKASAGESWWNDDAFRRQFRCMVFMAGNVCAIFPFDDFSCLCMISVTVFPFGMRMRIVFERWYIEEVKYTNDEANTNITHTNHPRHRTARSLTQKKWCFISRMLSSWIIKQALRIHKGDPLWDPSWILISTAAPCTL